MSYYQILKYIKKHEYIIIVISSIIVICLSLFFIMNHINSDNKTKDKNTSIEVSKDDDTNNNEKNQPNIDGGEIKKEEKIEDKINYIEALTFLVVGFDKSKGLTDVIMVAHYMPKNNKIKLISLPRDLYIDFENEFKDVKANNKDLKIRYCKLAEIYSNAGWNEQAVESLKETASIITGLNIDHHVLINLKSFRSVVDLVGGVEFDVPFKMDYDDPVQKLHIHLKKGIQTLNGEQAEELIRFRKSNYGTGHPDGDFGRIRMQQELLIQLLKKINEINSFDKIIGLFYNIYTNVKTDITKINAVKYVKYIFDLDMSKLLESKSMMTLLTNSKIIDGIWYEEWDKEESYKKIEELFKEEILNKGNEKK